MEGGDPSPGRTLSPASSWRSLITEASPTEPPPYAADLQNHRGDSITSDLVWWDGRLWYAKVPHGSPWPEMLAYRLAGRWLNIADVAYPDEAEDAYWLDGRPFTETNPNARALVRLGQDHAVDELPVQDHDEAMAGELVFSVWIRRRDAHPGNRAYVAGLPIFFDHHIAFGAESQNVPLDTFFRFGEDAGHAGRWRVRRLGDIIPTTESERLAAGKEYAIHRVHDLAAFDRHLNSAAARIQGMDADGIREHVIRSGAADPRPIVDLLVATRNELDDGVDRLRTVLRQGDPS